eukprot:746229-Hanusia_phi.AAC.7
MLASGRRSQHSENLQADEIRSDPARVLLSSPPGRADIARLPQGSKQGTRLGADGRALTACGRFASGPRLTCRTSWRLLWRAGRHGQERTS